MVKLFETSSFLLFFVTPALGIIVNSLSELPKATYDFVVIGGGTAGAVIANRLTENPRWKVLVIEAGPTHERVFNSRVPGLVSTLQSSPYDWNYTTVPQSGLNGRSILIPRGHILGGSSQINGLFYTRGSSSDYDRWAKVTGDPGWSWNKLLPYILKNEKWIEPSDKHNITGQYDPRFHNTNGKTYVSLSSAPQAIDAKVLQAGRELGGEYAFRRDMNSGDSFGIGWVQLTIGQGERSSSATAYFAPPYINRSNLHILVGHRATRILETGTQKRVPMLRTVRFVDEKSPNGPTHEVTATKEVILSAGAIGTPHLLFLSGIGDPTDLQAKGVKPLVNLPSVGKNLTDQPIFFLRWGIGINGTVEVTPELQQQWLAEWNATHTGPWSGIGLNQLGWGRIPDNSPIWSQFTDTASGGNTPHLEYGFGGDGMYPNPSNGITAVIIPVQPASRGSLSLNSTDPFDFPVIDFKFLSSAFDLFAIKHGVEWFTRFFRAPAWADYQLSLQSPYPDNEKDRDEFIRNSAGAAAHASGSAAMSARNASYGVVDPDLKLKKVFGLRIVDASIMPYITAGHTQAPVYAIAERAADLIKDDWK